MKQTYKKHKTVKIKTTVTKHVPSKYKHVQIYTFDSRNIIRPF